MGISLAYFGRYFGFDVVILVPYNTSNKMLEMLEKLGAEVILIDSYEEGFKKCKELEKTGNYCYIRQFENEYNYRAYFNMMEEIFKKQNNMDYIICGIGTAGTIRGIAEYIKENNLKTKIVGVKPFEKRMHSIEGIGAGISLPLFRLDLIDMVVPVKSIDALNEFKDNNSLGLGLSGAACQIVGRKILEKEPLAKILIIVADGKERYE